MQPPVAVGANGRLVGPVGNWRRMEGGAWEGFSNRGEGTMPVRSLLRQRVNRAGTQPYV